MNFYCFDVITFLLVKNAILVNINVLTNIRTEIGVRERYSIDSYIPFLGIS